MPVLRPTTFTAALADKAEHPDAWPIAGGTDVMVDVNFDRARPRVLLDLTAVPELRSLESEGDRLRVGAGVTYTTVIAELGRRAPGLALASRTVGSPQIRNRATVGGNLGSASPAGDALAPLLADDAEIEVASLARGVRRLPVADFLVGPKRNSLAADELIAAFWLRPSSGPQQFAKIGTRNAMVIAVCSCALVLRPERRSVAVALGSAAPTTRRAVAAEHLVSAELEALDLWQRRPPLPASLLERFAELVSEATSPIDDVRASARYRRHAVRVLAQRTLSWAWDDYRRS